MQTVKVGKYIYFKSNRKGRKLSVRVNNKKIHFGDINMQHYKDKTGLFSHLDHNDNNRRKKYLSRAKVIRNKNNEITYVKPESANYHSVSVLW